MTGSIQAKITLMALILIGVLFFAGCRGGLVAPNAPQEGKDPLTIAMQNELQRTTEVELVEEMARYRNAYINQLNLLADFYDNQGNHMKSMWVKEELDSLEMMPKHTYLVVAEIAGSDLKASRAIVEADALYEEGMALFEDGRGTLNLLTNKKKLYLARDKFNELITHYPDSDKIDDAAFQIAQINNHFLKDYRTAMIYYQRVWQWDPQTPWPARYEVARIYDRYFHDRIQAIEYYEMAIKMEPSYTANATNAANRIKELSNEQE